jgi:predicted nucleic acid-binding protein
VPAVVDASAVVEWLARGPGAAVVERLLVHDVVVAPELLDVEVVSALRRLVRARRLAPRDARRALDVLLGAPISRVPHLGLAVDTWARSGTLTAYDAVYVALAARLHCPLVTADANLARAPGLGVTVTLLSV